jgi:hypothetical protein
MCWQRSLRVEALLQTLQAKMNIQMCFIKIHKLKSSKYEWPLDVLKEIFESWSSIANTYYRQKGFVLELIFKCVLSKFVDFDKTHLDIYSRIKPVVFVIKLRLSKISVNTSKGHSYFEEFTLWIFIKHI